jgi:membrane fusion protein, copper/silver efflux system
MDLKILIPISGRLISRSNVAFQVYESDLKYIKPGLNFTGTSSLADEKDLSGKITSVDSIVDPTSRTIRVVGTLLKAPGSLISETTFSGQVTVELKDRVSIPESSVLHTGTGDLVYVFQERSKLEALPVKLGLKSEGFYEVLSGLQGGEFISSGPNFLIDSEAKIRGASAPSPGETKSALPDCPSDQHWDIPMSMCMPGKASK